MSHNGKLLTHIMNNLDKPGKVRIPKNQWQTPGEITSIPSRNITMQGVGFDALGMSPDGTVQYMEDGQDYYFPSQPVVEFPLMSQGGQHGGLDRWFAEKWVDIKSGKECGRKEGEKRKGYPACRPSRRVNEDTPKTSSELSSSERERFKRSKTSSERINYQHRRKENGGEANETDMANKPNNPALWSRAKSMAKQKFDVYPSAYANGWAAKWYKSKGGTWRKAMYGMEVPEMNAGGEPDNEGFQALPEYVQAKILSNMGYGGVAYPFMQQGGEPDGGMALGQIAAVVDKMSKLAKMIGPGSDLEPWVSSKLAVMDHYADAVSDYMTYNPEAQEESEGLPMPQMKNGGGIPQRYKNMGFTKVGVKKESTRPGKKWMVLAQKGNQYKVVHGGYDGMKDYTQHGSEKRRDRFWDRMGGKNSAKATDPFSPLYWHKRFGTWEDGGELMFQNGGSFGQSFAQARREGKKVFTWNGKSYTTQTAEDNKQTKPISMIQNSGGNPPVKRPAAPAPKPVARKSAAAPQEREVVLDNRNIFQRMFNMDEEDIRRFNLPLDVYDAYQQQREPNKGKRFGIVSKKNARAYFFDPEGNLAVQDEVGFGKDKGDAQPVFYQVMTTPSGTYNMERGNFSKTTADKMRGGYDANNFFYIDHTDPSKRLVDAPGRAPRPTPRQAIHGLPVNLKKERSKAFGNKTTEDNYMSAGCINCKREFLDNPYFNEFTKGQVYVLPEKKGGGSTWSGNTWYQSGGQSGEDSTLENIAEVFDPTGITSWDDVYRSYQQSGVSPQTALELLGALPLIGKAGKLTKAGIHLKKYKGVDAAIRKALPQSRTLSNSLMGAAAAGRGSDAFQAAQQASAAPLFPFNMGGAPCYECGGMYAYGGMWNKQQGGPVAGDEMEVTPEQAEMLRQMGYQFEII